MSIDKYIVVSELLGELPLPVNTFDEAVAYVQEIYANSGDVKLIHRKFTEWTDTPHIISTDFDQLEQESN
jgi:hypothetical protein